MCELFGFCSDRPTKLNNELLEFFSHSPQHPDGWGLAVERLGVMNVEKEPVEAGQSGYLRHRLEAGVVATAALGHIRYATIGGLNRDNCHPYSEVDASGRIWTLIHNGTIFQHDQSEAFRYQQKGDTDSERILLWFVSLINVAISGEAHPLTASERFAIINQAVCQLCVNNNKVNLLLHDGELLYAHTNYADTLYVRKGEGNVCLSTQPLALGNWEPAPFTTLLAYEAGKQAFVGTSHGHESLPDEERLQALRKSFVG